MYVHMYCTHTYVRTYIGPVLCELYHADHLINYGANDPLIMLMAALSANCPVKCGAYVHTYLHTYVRTYSRYSRYVRTCVHTVGMYIHTYIQ